MDKLEERLRATKKRVSYMATNRTAPPIKSEYDALINPDGPKALAEITRLKGEVEDATDELARIVALNDDATTKWGGLADCTDNDGEPYQSQALANCIERARLISKARSSGKAGSDA